MEVMEIKKMQDVLCALERWDLIIVCKRLSVFRPITK